MPNAAQINLQSWQSEKHQLMAPLCHQDTPVFRQRPVLMICGEMAEWSKAPHSKCGVPVTVPRVRIPISPPFSDLPKYQFSSKVLILNSFYPNLVSDSFRNYPPVSFQKGKKWGETFFRADMIRRLNTTQEMVSAFILKVEL